MTAAFDLTDVAIARTPTPRYGEIRKPFTSPLPDLESATDDEWLDLAANVLRLDSDMHAVASSPQHIRGLCRQLERMDVKSLAMDEVRAADLTEVNRLRDKLIDMSDELAVTRQAMAEMARRFHDQRKGG